MSDIRSYTMHAITHKDGWSYTVEKRDDGLLRIVYNDGVSVTMAVASPEAARRIAASLIELADDIEPKSEAVAAQSSEFQTGFLTGLAYAAHGEEAIDMAAMARGILNGVKPCESN